MKYESVKIGNTTYSIANGSCSLDNLSGYTATVAIIIGPNSIEDIHKNLMENNTITKYSAEGVEEWKRDNLVYTGKMALRSSFPVRIEQVQETDKKGKTVYINKEAMDSVVIVEYRTPNIQDEIKLQKAQIVNLNAQIENMSMISGIEMESNNE